MKDAQMKNDQIESDRLDRKQSRATNGDHVKADITEELGVEDYIAALWPALRKNAINQFMESSEGLALVTKNAETQLVDPKDEAETLRAEMAEHLDSVLEQILAGKTIAQIQGMDEAHLNAIYSVAEAQMKSGEIENASSLFQLLIILDPTIAKHYTGFGACQQLLKNYEHALELYAIAQLQDMSDPRVPQNAAMCCIFLGRISQARGMAHRALSICETALGTTEQNLSSEERREMQRLALKSQQLLQLIDIRSKNAAKNGEIHDKSPQTTV